MSTNELTLTLVGWLGTEPKHYPGGGGTTPFTSFRMASTRRWFDRERGVWADGRTEWFTVKCWRGAARNIAESLRKGDPVIVHGRLSTDEWASPEGNRTTLVLDAIAVGPDLAYGTARFARTVHPEDASDVRAEGGSEDAPEPDDATGPDLGPDEASGTGASEADVFTVDAPALARVG